MTDAIPAVKVEKTGPCLLCEEGVATLSYEEQAFHYGPEEDGIELHATVPVWTCAECDEQYLGEEAEEIRHAAVCAWLGRLNPAEIKAIRVDFGMLQDDFAKLTGFGIASIKRWESGAQIQTDSADKHLRLLRALGLGKVLTLGVPPKPAKFRTVITEDAKERSKLFRLHDLPMAA
jgi:putative zinc finger/helix-turn-helix YgiT family protein